ncbi:hypothetical protein [Mucilaginibacter sp. L196]|uniref:hypothetical protein n=1 Tax=Mucilaginibacter sp. L196 TaxID=1641870 RepID=UPI00131B284F|nr:hypothetical protein [Mucilaginibacter sp. L196]
MKTQAEIDNNAAIAKLKELAKNNSIAKHPNIPPNYIHVYSYNYKTANGLTRCLIDYIKFIGGYATRINTAGIWDEKLQMFRPGITDLGTADIHAVLFGKHLSIEVKIGVDKLSDYQRKTRQKVSAAGGLYIVARDFKTVVDFIERLKNG